MWKVGMSEMSANSNLVSIKVTGIDILLILVVREDGEQSPHVACTVEMANMVQV